MTDEIQNAGPTFDIVLQIVKALEPLSADDRDRVMRTATTWLEIGSFGRASAAPLVPSVTQPSPSAAREPSSLSDEKFSNRPVLSVKDFVFEKDPATEPERLACLAYYLTHYMETPYFKTADLNHLNAEAAQRKLSNPAVAASNAMRDGLFVLAPKAGHKQLSAMGERFVHALPDREAAQKIKLRNSARRSRASGHSETDAEVSEERSQETAKG
jgi:hypothetical protein